MMMRKISVLNPVDRLSLDLEDTNILLTIKVAELTLGRHGEASCAMHPHKDSKEERTITLSSQVSVSLHCWGLSSALWNENTDTSEDAMMPYFQAESEHAVLSVGHRVKVQQARSKGEQQ